MGQQPASRGTPRHCYLLGITWVLPIAMNRVQQGGLSPPSSPAAGYLQPALETCHRQGSYKLPAGAHCTGTGYLLADPGPLGTVLEVPRHTPGCTYGQKLFPAL